MKGEIAAWNYGLLYASLIVVLSVVGVVSAERPATRWFSSGLFLQGVILMFIVGAARFPGSVDLRIGGLAVAGLLIVQQLLVSHVADHDELPPEEGPPA